MIKISDPYASYLSNKNEINEAVKKVLNSGWYILGSEVENFEKEFASYHGENFYSVGVANGTDAIRLCLLALGLGKEDEIITPSHTAVATISAIESAGCKPVFADIDPISLCIDPKSIEKRITSKTKAIIPVHIFGQPAEMAKILEIASDNQIDVIEDCSQAHGAEINAQKVGTFGKLSAFSCYPTKNLGGTGDSGVILSRSKELTDKLKSLRQYGWSQERESVYPGTNSRLDEIQAAILRVKLKYLNEGNKKRRIIAKRYIQGLKNLPLILPSQKVNELHAMHLFVIESENRNNLLRFLRSKNIGAALHYSKPVHHQKAYADRIAGSEDLKVTENFYKKNLTLPIFPELSLESVDMIISTIQDWRKF